MEFDHFVTAQKVYESVIGELAAGQKRSHWMWFIFPQIRGLGFSDMSQRFALDSIDAAKRYLQHPLLGARLIECTQLVLRSENSSAEEIFGGIDSLKLRSCMTLFALASAPGSVFETALQKFFGGTKDPRTLSLLGVGDADSSANPP